ncbi:hypothetical protein [Ralstonia chuxiongensis]|uniref:hypothetical protein n=1 Tax=Ralstonia chuxiongensis TaxID=2957504 RepID=UPI00292DDEB7|nr:hypothetical protein [Ralstonia chuxiongensis]
MGVPGWHLSRSDRASTASSALEHALIARFAALGRAPKPFLLRSDNGLVFTSRNYTVVVRSYGLRQEFITLHCTQQNGMVERVIRTLKEQCVHRHRFETRSMPAARSLTGFSSTTLGAPPGADDEDPG